MAKAGKSSYKVGFGKPPRSAQFRPGQSGNPAGRRRGAKNFATAIEEELRSRVTITENGKRKRVPSERSSPSISSIRQRADTSRRSRWC
jgi:hypothetical protein